MHVLAGLQTATHQLLILRLVVHARHIQREGTIATFHWPLRFHQNARDVDGMLHHDLHRLLDDLCHRRALCREHVALAGSQLRFHPAGNLLLNLWLLQSNGIRYLTDQSTHVGDHIQRGARHIGRLA